MIEITIDRSRLDAKLRDAMKRIATGIETGMKAGAQTLSKEIDDFMFVPLAFNTDVTQRSDETVAKMNVALNIPRQVVRNRKPFRHRRTFKAREKKKPIKPWPNYVREITSNSDALANSVEDSIREELR